jgi:DNA ligase-1
MKTFDTLYARNSNGNINEWRVQVNEFTFFSQICINEGLLDGKKTSNIIEIKKGKNIGKMNETTAYEQACNEAQSRWEKKKKQGYKSLSDLNINYKNYLINEGDTITLNNAIEVALPQNRTDANNLSKPMKAQPYFDDKGNVRIKFPCFGQPKLNGFRVMARWEEVEEGEGLFKTKVEKVVFRSKEGLKYDILEHIEKSFTKDMFITTKGYTLTFDGEMYIHGEILSEISSAVRKRNSKTEKLGFHIFDIAVENIKQDERLAYMNTFINRPNIYFLKTHIVKNNEEAQIFTDECIKKGFEGAIFRDMKATYQFGKRPKTMVKLKRFQDKEFKIVDVVGGDNAPELGVFICVQEQGLQFKVNPEGNHEIKKEYLINKNKYIGKKLTVRFFERTKDNLPFHAVGIAIRDYE